MTTPAKWTVRLITPNHIQAKNEVDHWIAQGYSTHYSQSKKQVMIKKAGPGQTLFMVRTRVKP